MNFETKPVTDKPSSNKVFTGSPGDGAKNLIQSMEKQSLTPEFNAFLQKAFEYQIRKGIYGNPLKSIYNWNLSERIHTKCILGNSDPNVGDPKVRFAQSSLVRAGYSLGDYGANGVDGKPGKLTSQAIKEFKQTVGLEYNSDLDATTMFALDLITEKGFERSEIELIGRETHDSLKQKACKAKDNKKADKKGDNKKENKPSEEIDIIKHIKKQQLQMKYEELEEITRQFALSMLYSETHESFINYYQEWSYYVGQLEEIEKQMGKFDGSHKDAITRGEELLGTDYEHAYSGYYKGDITVTEKISSLDCTEFISYVYKTPLYRTWEFDKNSEFKKVDNLQRNDVIVFNVYNEKGKFVEGHASIFTREGGERAILHSSKSLGVSYSKDYVEAYYKKTYPNYRIDVGYYRKK